MECELFRFLKSILRPFSIGFSPKIFEILIQCLIKFNQIFDIRNTRFKDWFFQHHVKRDA